MSTDDSRRIGTSAADSYNSLAHASKGELRETPAESADAPEVRSDAPDSLTRARASGLLTVAELASYLQVEPSYVYAHAEELGALRLGTGPRARLRFDLEDVKKRISCVGGRESTRPDAASQAVSRRRRRRSLGTSVPLLPIRGQIPAQNGAGEAA